MKYFHLKESFFPVLIVFVLLLLSVIYSENRSIQKSEETIYIDVPESLSKNSADVENIVTNDEIIIDLDQVDVTDSRYLKAAQYIKEEKWEESENIYRTLLVEEPASRAYSELGVVLLKQGKIVEALAMAKAALEQSPVYKNALFNLAIIYDKSSQDR